MINAYTHTYKHTYIHTYIYTYIHTHIHIYIHAYIHIYIHTYIHTNIKKDSTHSISVCCTGCYSAGTWVPCLTEMKGNNKMMYWTIWYCTHIVSGCVLGSHVGRCERGNKIIMHWIVSVALTLFKGATVCPFFSNKTKKH